MSHADDLARRSSLLRFVPEAQQAAVLALFDRVEYAFGDEIVAEGDPADAWYIVVSGRARVLRRQPDGEEIMLGRLLPGDEFGEAALHAGGVRNATVRASTTLSALRLARARFAELLRQQPALQQALELQSRWRTLHGFLYQFRRFRPPAGAGAASADGGAGSASRRARRVDRARGRRQRRPGDPAVPAARWPGAGRARRASGWRCTAPATGSASARW
jgi:CRP-like cAMP-binding protein